MNAMPYFHIEDLLLSRCVVSCYCDYWGYPFGGDTRSFASLRMTIGDRMPMQRFRMTWGLHFGMWCLIGGDTRSFASLRMTIWMLEGDKRGASLGLHFRWLRLLNGLNREWLGPFSLPREER